MFDIVRKDEYWQWIDEFESRRESFAEVSESNLKDIQDHYILGQLSHLSGKKILEVGGGKSRILELLAKNNECWNADGFEGRGAGPKTVYQIPKCEIGSLLSR